MDQEHTGTMQGCRGGVLLQAVGWPTPQGRRPGTRRTNLRRGAGGLVTTSATSQSRSLIFLEQHLLVLGTVPVEDVAHDLIGGFIRRGEEQVVEDRPLRSPRPHDHWLGHVLEARHVFETFLEGADEGAAGSPPLDLELEEL